MCFVFNLSFKNCNYEIFEKNFDWKSEEKIVRFQSVMNMFYKCNIRINDYYTNYITNIHSKEIEKLSNKSLESLLDMIVIYFFLANYNKNEEEINYDDILRFLNSKDENLCYIDIFL